MPDEESIDQKYYSRYRPCIGGSWLESSGKTDQGVKARGPLACWVKDRTTGLPVLLSSVRVIGKTGDLIYQPSTEDGNKIATVVRHNDLLPRGSIWWPRRNELDVSIGSFDDPAIASRAILALFPQRDDIPMKFKELKIRDEGKLFAQSPYSLTDHSGATIVSGKIADISFRRSVILEKYAWKNQILVEDMTGQIGAGLFTEEGDLIGLITHTFGEGSKRYTLACKATIISEYYDVCGWSE